MISKETLCTWWLFYPLICVVPFVVTFPSLILSILIPLFFVILTWPSLSTTPATLKTFLKCQLRHQLKVNWKSQISTWATAKHIGACKEHRVTLKITILVERKQILNLIHLKLYRASSPLRNHGTTSSNSLSISLAQ